MAVVTNMVVTVVIRAPTDAAEPITRLLLLRKLPTADRKIEELYITIENSLASNQSSNSHIN
jgi:hypothetical protein